MTRRPTVSQILDAAATVHHVGVDDVLSTHRSETLASARATAVRLMRDLRGMSYPEIARAIRRSGHSTVIDMNNRAAAYDVTHAKALLIGAPVEPEPVGPRVARVLAALEGRFGRDGLLTAIERVLLKALQEGEVERAG